MSTSVGVERPTLNKAALRAVLAYIDADPSRWDQRHFRSLLNDTMCLAGIACHLAGLDPLDLMAQEDGDPMAVYFTAQELLGFTALEADELFLQFVSWRGCHPSAAALREEIKAVTGWDANDND